MKTRFLDFINKNYESFKDWFDTFTYQVYNFGYNGPIISETFIKDWKNKKRPYIKLQKKLYKK